MANLLIFESPRVELTILPVSSDMISSIKWVFIFSLDSADVIAVGVTLLKAPCISRKAHNTNSVVDKDLSSCDTREWRAGSVNLPLQ